MKLRHCFVAGVLVLASACAANPTAPSPNRKALHDGGGLMGSGLRTDPPPPPPTPAE